MILSKARRREIAEWILAAVIAVIFAVMLFALATVWQDPKKGIGSSDAAAWIQAIGSIAAIFGALWIYSAQARAQSKVDAIKAKLAAARYMPGLALIASESKRMADVLGDEMACAYGSEPFHKARSILVSEFSWDTSDLAFLSPLPDNCAQNLAAGLGYLEAARVLLDKAIARPELESDAEYRTRNAVKLVRLLCAAHIPLDRAGRVMDSISRD